MPELKTCDTSSFTPHLISVDEIPFKSKSYEKKTKLVKIKKGDSETCVNGYLGCVVNNSGTCINGYHCYAVNYSIMATIVQVPNLFPFRTQLTV